MEVVHQIIVNLKDNTRTHTIEVRNDTVNAVKMSCTLLNGDKALDMSDVLLATIRGVKPSGAIVYADATIEQDEEGNNINVVSYVFSKIALAEVGHSTYTVTLMSSEAQLICSFDIYVDVLNQLYDEAVLWGENDLSAMRSYMTRALNACQTAEEVRNTFEVGIGSVEQIIADMEDELGYYRSYLEELQQMVDSGAFIGAMGPQGPAGKDGVITTTEGMVAFAIENDGELAVYSAEQSVAESFELSDDGELIYEVED